jgi:aminoglycoside phosphotransferase (APT) family kinase protein
MASGMEGHVFDIGDEQVAKVWFGKSDPEIVRLQSFYEMVNDLGLPFATPLITEVQTTRGSTVSIERRLHGTPLIELISRNDALPPQFATDAVLSVLQALREHPVTDANCLLPILGIESSGVARSAGPSGILLEVASRKVERYGDQLRRSVGDFDRVYGNVIRHVRQIDIPAMHLIHGDLCPPNIFLGADLEVSAVVDWGFLSLVGDATFDASITCGIYDMYSEHHLAIDDFLRSECSREMGDNCNRLLIYRALYAILTSNAYSEDGSDGHYEWCVAALNRPDIRNALSLNVE